MDHEHKKSLGDRIQEWVVVIAVGMAFYLFAIHTFPSQGHEASYVVYDVSIVLASDADTGVAEDKAGNKFFILGTADGLDLRIHQDSEELTLSCRLFGQSSENLILEDCAEVESQNE